MDQAKAYTQKDIQMFSRPLIIGASISAGYGTRDGGPGSVLARAINPQTNITNLSISGATSVQSTAHVNFSLYEPSIVIGFDLFFWDAARNQTGINFEKNTRRIFRIFNERKVPMIIGKIPAVDLPFGLKSEELKKSSEKVNKLLEELFTLENNCLLYCPLNCFLSMDSENYFSDNLHLTPEGNKYCANYFADSGDFRKLSLGPELEVA